MSRSEGFRDEAWARDHGAVAGSPQLVRLEVRGKTAEPVTVTRIAIDVVRRSSPVRGWYIADPACGASSPHGDGAVEIDDQGRPFRVTTEIGSNGFQPDFSGEHPKLRRDHDWDNGLHAC